MKKILYSLSAAVLLTLGIDVCSADVRITMKNGRTVFADSCREANGRLICQTGSGTFEIEKKDMAGMQDVKTGAGRLNNGPVEVQEAPAPDRTDNGKQPASKVVIRPGEGTVVKGLTPEQISRLEQINERKTILKPEREKLMQERDQLHEHVKNAGVVRAREQFDALKKRISDLDSRIAGFNEEVKKLNEEEKVILEGGPK